MEQEELLLVRVLTSICKEFGVISDIDDGVMTIKIAGDDLEYIHNAFSYLNFKAGTNFNHKSKQNRGFAMGLKRAGHSFDTIKAVIDAKAEDWIGTEFQKFLRPSTIFRLNKFEEYAASLTNVGKTATMHDLLKDDWE